MIKWDPLAPPCGKLHSCGSCDDRLRCIGAFHASVVEAEDILRIIKESVDSIGVFNIPALRELLVKYLMFERDNRK